MESWVRWGTGLWAQAEGVLTLENGRLALKSEAEEVFAIRVPAPGVLRWPWIGMNTSFTVRIGERKYSVTFMPSAAGGSRWLAALDTGAQWKSAIERGTTPVGGQRRWIRGARVITGLLWLLLPIMGSLLGLVVMANPDGGPFQLYRVFGGLMIVVSLMRIWMAIRNLRGSR